MKKNYDCVLSNDCCIFDSEVFKDAELDGVLEWAFGRGGKYVLQISSDEVVLGISVSIDDVNKKMFYYDGWEWIEINREKLEELLW